MTLCSLHFGDIQSSRFDMTAVGEGEIEKITFETPLQRSKGTFDHSHDGWHKSWLLAREGKVQCNFFFGESHVCGCHLREIRLLYFCWLLKKSSSSFFTHRIRGAEKKFFKKFSRSLKSKQLRKNSNKYFWDFSKHFHSHFLVDFSFYKRENDFYHFKSTYVHQSLERGMET